MSSGTRFCPSCRFAGNRPGAKFCRRCGGKLPTGSAVACPGCGQLVQSGMYFCQHCGTALNHPVPQALAIGSQGTQPELRTVAPAPAAVSTTLHPITPSAMAKSARLRPTGKLAPTLGISPYSLFIGLVTLGSALSVAAVAVVQFISGDGIAIFVGVLNVLATLELLYLAYAISVRNRGAYAHLMATCKRGLGWFMTQATGWGFLVDSGLVSEESIEATIGVLVVWAVFDLSILALLYLGRGHLTALSAGGVQTGDLVQPSRVLLQALQADIDTGLITATERDELLAIRADFIRWLGRQRKVVVQALNQESDAGPPIDVLAVQADKQITPLLWLFRGALQSPVDEAQQVLRRHSGAWVCIIGINLTPAGQAQVDKAGEFGKPTIYLLSSEDGIGGINEAGNLWADFLKKRK